MIFHANTMANGKPPCGFHGGFPLQRIYTMEYHVVSMLVSVGHGVPMEYHKNTMVIPRSTDFHLGSYTWWISAGHGVKSNG